MAATPGVRWHDYLCAVGSGVPATPLLGQLSSGRHRDSHHALDPKVSELLLQRVPGAGLVQICLPSATAPYALPEPYYGPSPGAVLSSCRQNLVEGTASGVRRNGHIPSHCVRLSAAH